jgi:hypothetical protein
VLVVVVKEFLGVEFLCREVTEVELDVTDDRV